MQRALPAKLPLNPARQQGFTLVELMVSIALGVVLMGGVAGLYLESRRNMAQDEELARLQESARYVLGLLKHEIASSGYYGGVGDPSLIDVGSVASDCSAADWALDPATPLEIVDEVDVAGASVQSLAGSTWTCLDNTELQDGSDLISIKRTADTATLSDGVVTAGGEDINQWYLRSFDYSDHSWIYLSANIAADEKTPGSTVDYWEYYARIYYLRNFSEAEDDGIPMFCEARLVESEVEPRCLVEGVEDMQFELGVDNDGDGVAEQYLSSPAAADFDNAVAVRVYLLMRSVNPIRGYTNEKAYRLGDKVIAPFNDAFIRKVYTTTVKIRNGINT